MYDPSNPNDQYLLHNNIDSSQASISSHEYGPLYIVALLKMSDQDLAAAVVLVLKLKKRKRRWSKEWFKKRQKYTYERLLRDLALTDVNDFNNFVRLDITKFQELLDLVTPLIEKKNTNMREAIPPFQRLSITLRYLATGNTLEDLKFHSAISPQSLSLIIMETCDAIIQVLRHFIKVRKKFYYKKSFIY